MSNEDFHNMRFAVRQTLITIGKPVMRIPHLAMLITIAVMLWLVIMASCFILVKVAGG